MNKDSSWHHSTSLLCLQAKWESTNRWRERTSTQKVCGTKTEAGGCWEEGEDIMLCSMRERWGWSNIKKNGLRVAYCIIYQDKMFFVQCLSPLWDTKLLTMWKKRTVNRLFSIFVAEWTSSNLVINSWKGN